MQFMNSHEISEAMIRHRNHPILSKATQFLDAFKEEVDSHSDGWAHWSAPVKACDRLMTLIKEGNLNTTAADYQRALQPIRSFMTRRGFGAGMKMPETGVIAPKWH